MDNPFNDNNNFINDSNNNQIPRLLLTEIKNMINSKTKKLIIVSVISIVFLLTFYFISSKSKNTNMENHIIKWGIYDPQKTLLTKQSSKIEYEHIFWGWEKNGIAKLESQLNERVNSKQKIILTAEPWPFFEYTNYYEEMMKTNKEVYEEKIQKMCQSLSSHLENSKKDEIFLRIGHEMDLVKKVRYPWAAGDISGFKDFFITIHKICKKVDTRIKLIWSPSGNPGSEYYYPGNEFVDIIGVSLFSNPEWEQKNMSKVYTFKELLDIRYDTLKQFKKPIWIAEGGVAKWKDDHQSKWWSAAKNEVLTNPKYDLLEAFVYFYSSEEYPWYNSDNLPDYRIPEL
ncbi:MAG: glycosyl hydrolase [Patescibacteria group bacterium]